MQRTEAGGCGILILSIPYFFSKTPLRQYRSAQPRGIIIILYYIAVQRSISSGRPVEPCQFKYRPNTERRSAAYTHFNAHTHMRTCFMCVHVCNQNVINNSTRQYKKAFLKSDHVFNIFTRP